MYIAPQYCDTTWLSTYTFTLFPKLKALLVFVRSQLFKGCKKQHSMSVGSRMLYQMKPPTENLCSGILLKQWISSVETLQILSAVHQLFGEFLMPYYCTLLAIYCKTINVGVHYSQRFLKNDILASTKVSVSRQLLSTQCTV